MAIPWSLVMKAISWLGLGWPYPSDSKEMLRGLQAPLHVSTGFPRSGCLLAFLILTTKIMKWIVLLRYPNIHTQPYYGRFCWTNRVSRCQKNLKKCLLLDFIVQREISRGTHTNSPGGRHSMRTNQRPPPCPIFMLDALPATMGNLSWLGTGTKYAGLHTAKT